MISLHYKSLILFLFVAIQATGQYIPRDTLSNQINAATEQRLRGYISDAYKQYKSGQDLQESGIILAALGVVSGLVMASEPELIANADPRIRYIGPSALFTAGVAVYTAGTKKLKASNKLRTSALLEMVPLVSTVPEKSDVRENDQKRLINDQKSLSAVVDKQGSLIDNQNATISKQNEQIRSLKAELSTLNGRINELSKSIDRKKITLPGDYQVPEAENFDIKETRLLAPILNYRIQIAASDKEMTFSGLSDIGKVHKVQIPGKTVYRYQLGDFSKEEINGVLNIVKARGYTDAFIVMIKS